MLKSCAALLISSLLAISPTSIQAKQLPWKLTKIDAIKIPKRIISQLQRKASDGLPDGLVATYPSKGDVQSAWYGKPTKRYTHGILGDAVELLEFTLPHTQVFEDRYPRLVDLDGDGAVEIITIKSSTKLGGSVTVFGLKNGKLVEKASSGYIGRSNRWLNIAGIEQFSGGKKSQIAYVQTPHIGGTLFFLNYDGKRLTKIASMAGFSNHAIGSREMRLSATADLNKDGILDLAVPSADRRQLRFVGFVAGKLRDFGHVFLPSPIDKAIAVEQNGSKVVFTVGLANGEVYQISK